MSKQIIPANAGLYVAEVTLSARVGFYMDLSPLIAWHWIDADEAYQPFDLYGRVHLCAAEFHGNKDEKPIMMTARVIWDAVSDIYTASNKYTGTHYHGKKELRTGMQCDLDLEIEEYQG